MFHEHFAESTKLCNKNSGEVC